MLELFMIIKFVWFLSINML